MVVADSRLELPAVPAAPGMARAFVRGCWSHAENEETIDAVELCVSELVTNALDHATPPYVLHVERRCGRLRIEVEDTCERPPVARPLTPTSGRGRGIFIVEHTATRWGFDWTDAGKTVWAEFATNKPVD